MTTSFGPANIPVSGDGVLDTSCIWAGDASATYTPGLVDTTPEPLVADSVDSTLIPNPFSCTNTPSGCVSTNYGGGFTAEVRVTGLDPVCNIQITSIDCPNAFDITVSYDPKVLNAVAFDQYGLEFCPSATPPCGQPGGSGGITTVTTSIDNTLGKARLAQTLLAVRAPPDTGGNQGVTLFRVRFDVVGVGTSNILASGTIANPGNIVHTEQAATFEDTTFFDPTALGWLANFTFTPNPPVPGSSLKFTASASCPRCTGTLGYAWDFSSHGGAADSTANPATITPPPPTVNRVTLTITDGAAHSVTLVQLVPFAVALNGPASIAVGAAASYNGLWLGGTPTYSGTMRLCPGVLSPPQLLVCTNPAPAVAATAAETAPASNTYHFAGVFTNKLTISTTASGGVGGVSLTAIQVTNVTGSPAAFTVTASASPTSISPGGSVGFTATAAYAATYPAYAASADTLISGTAPALGTALFQDNTHIRFVEQAGCVGCQINGLWDPSEWIFFCPAGCTTLPASGAVVIYTGTVAQPGAGTATKSDGHIKFTGGAAFVQGHPVIYDWDGSTPGGLYDASLTYTFKFGDGTQTTVSTGLASTSSGGITATTSHNYPMAGTFQPSVLVQETGTPAGTLGPLSAIQEAGFTAQVTVGVAAPTVTVICGSATAGKPVTCFATASGGSGTGFTFAWSAPGGTPSTGTGGSFTTTYAAKGSETITVTVTDSAGGTGTNHATFTVAGQSIVVTVTCGTATVGKPVSCSASATGGTGPYTFTWSSNGSPITGTGASYTPTFAAKGPQTVTATAKDANSATMPGTASITVTGQPIVVTVTCGTATVAKPVTCNASATGGTGPYTFAWSSSGSPGTGTGASYTTTFAAKGPQTVTATATDANTVAKAGTASITVTGQPIVTDFTFLPTSPRSGDQVTFTATASGGTGPYSFSWNFGDSSAAGTGSPAMHSYSVTVATTFHVVLTTMDANGATKTATHDVIVTPVAGITVAVTCGTATVGKPVTCNAAPSGGTGTFTSISWSAPGGNPATGTGTSFTTTYSAKGSKTITATATDSSSATGSGNANVAVTGQPIVVTVTCGAATAGKPVTCNASATGGTGPYSFAWSSNGTPGTGTGAGYTTTFAGKGAQTVTATATDGNSVTMSGSASVTVAAQPIVTDFTFTPTSPTSGQDITFTASASGGTGPYTFTWDFGDSTAAGTGSPAHHTYTVTVSTTFTVILTTKDANAATKTATHTVTVTPIGPGLAVSVSCGTATVGKPVTCTATVTGGTLPYGTVSWSAPGATPATGTGPSFTTTYAAKAAANTVTATVTDAASTTKSGIATVAVTGQPIVVTVTCGTATAGKPVTCNASATGGTAPYTFTWSSSGTPASGTGASYTTTFAAKGPQTVTATATDANIVAKSGTASVTVTGQPIVPDFTSSVTGQVVQFTASATGGTPPYTFTWDFGDSMTGTGPSVSHTYASSGTFTVVLTAKDTNAVTATATHTVTTGAVSPTVTVSCGSATVGKPVTCNATASGGSGTGFTFTWSAPGGTPATGTGASFTTNYAAKGSETITATVTDSAGGTGSKQATFTVTGQPIVVTVTCGAATAGKQVTCTVSATGGTGPYAFSWSSNGSPATGTGTSYTTTFSAKGSQTVTATVTDGNGVTASGTASVTVSPQPVTFTITVNPTSPAVGSQATFTATVTGGTAPYSFSWNFGDNSPTGSGNPVQHTYSTAGTFTVALTVMDANGVSATASITVTTTVREQFTVDFAPKLTIVGNTTFVPLITGGSAPFSCTWNFGDGSALATTCLVTHFYKSSGKFTVTLTVTDSSSATATSTSPVRVQSAPRISGQKVQEHILPGQTENITVTVRNFSTLTVDITLSVQVFDITHHANTLVTTLTKTFTVGPSSSMTVVLSWTPPSVRADYRDVATISYSHSFGDLNGDGTPETVTGASPFQSRRGFSVKVPEIDGQNVQAHLNPGETAIFNILVRNPTPYPGTFTLTVQIFNITRDTHTLVATLVQTFTIGPSTTTTATMSWTPPAVIADYLDAAQITGTSFQSKRGFSVV